MQRWPLLTKVSVLLVRSATLVCGSDVRCLARCSSNNQKEPSSRFPHPEFVAFPSSNRIGSNSQYRCEFHLAKAELPADVANLASLHSPNIPDV